ncbi:hypothetical protein F4810DRAFT_706913 [Camillea tinctor]|nr:hypothetical protein F4810DRAFT_706913 [Camillea tinctor]
MPALFKNPRSMMDRIRPHQNPSDDTPRRPNWVKQPALLAPDVQPIVLDVLYEHLRLPLETQWHSAAPTMADRVFTVLSSLPRGHRPWCVAQLPEDFVAALGLVFQPAVVREVAGPVRKHAEAWCRRECSGAEVRRCSGRAFHPRVLFFSLAIAVMARVCERCEREHPSHTEAWIPPPPAEDGEQRSDEPAASIASSTSSIRGTLHILLSRSPPSSSSPSSPPCHRYRLGPIEVPPVKQLREYSDSALAEQLARANHTPLDRALAWSREKLLPGRGGGGKASQQDRGSWQNKKKGEMNYVTYEECEDPYRDLYEDYDNDGSEHEGAALEGHPLCRTAALC